MELKGDVFFPCCETKAQQTEDDGQKRAERESGIGKTIDNEAAGRTKDGQNRDLDGRRTDRKGGEILRRYSFSRPEY
jgi:uncharacterized Zn finger protein (UPF0148 family)